MRAFLVTSPRESAVVDVAPPVAGPGQVVVDVERVGVCGTDVEFFTGEMAYLTTGQESFPVRLGHEWCGTVSAVGEGVDPGLVGRRTTGDTMLGCQQCDRCRSGVQHLCADRYEIGIRHGWPGALAEQLPVPAWALHLLPDSVDDVAGAMVEPGGNALRAVRAAALSPGDRLLVLGPGTIGLLTALFAVAVGAEVHVLGLPGRMLDFAGTLGLAGAWTREDLPDLPWHAVVDASGSAELPALALELVQPGRRVVYIGLPVAASPVDARQLTLKDVTAVGILSASPGLAGAVEHYADGRVDPRPLVGATVGLDQVAGVLSGEVSPPVGRGPKIQVDPRLLSGQTR
jgi:threonine dehydrogenase-like Zn-dependent dehydrogenase